MWETLFINIDLLGFQGASRPSSISIVNIIASNTLLNKNNKNFADLEKNFVDF